MDILASGEFTNYAIVAGSYSARECVKMSFWREDLLTFNCSLGSQRSFSISPVYQNETIVINIALNCPGSTGPSASALLYVNNTLVSQTSVACGGNTNGQISYVL